MIEPCRGRVLKREAEGPSESPERTKKEMKGSYDVNLVILLANETEKYQLRLLYRNRAGALRGGRVQSLCDRNMATQMNNSRTK